MRPNQDNTVKVQGSLGGQTKTMSFDENSIEHIMSVLTNLYSDPELAVIREYSTNAYDSHRAAGTDKPIEVYAASHLSPQFIVKDYGIGMSVDDINEIYSKYGASTKRDTDEETGMLGLGCKSALTYTNQFTLIAVKNGVQITVSVSRDDQGRGQVEIVDTCSTDEPNGVEVRIPTRYIDSLNQKCADFFSYWPKGSVLLNGKEPKKIDGMWINDNIVVVDDHSYNGRDTIVMGNVPYKVVGDYRLHQQSSMRRKRIVAWVPMGSVNFTPSRESLHYTQRTMATIEKLKKDVHDGIVAAAEKEIATAKNRGEAFEKAHRWKDILGNNVDLKYKNMAIPYSLQINHIHYDVNRYRYAAVRYHEIRGDMLFGSMRYGRTNKFLVVENFPSDQLASHNRQKIKEWTAQNDPDINIILLLSGSTDKWLENITTVDWSKIKEIKLSKGKFIGSYKAIPGSYDVLTDKKGYMSFQERSDIPVGAEVIYYSSAEEYNGVALQKMFPNAYIVQLPKNRWDKFARENPQVKHAYNAVKQELDKTVKNLNEHDKIVMSVPYSYHEFANKLNKQFGIPAIDDPDVREFLKIAAKNTFKDQQAVDNYKTAKQACRAVGMEVPPLSWDNPLRNYRLLEMFPHDKLEADIEYINAVYAYRNKEQNNEV